MKKKNIIWSLVILILTTSKMNENSKIAQNSDNTLNVWIQSPSQFDRINALMRSNYSSVETDNNQSVKANDEDTVSTSTCESFLPQSMGHQMPQMHQMHPYPPALQASQMHPYPSYQRYPPMHQMHQCPGYQTWPPILQTSQTQSMQSMHQMQPLIPGYPISGQVTSGSHLNGVHQYPPHQTPNQMANTEEKTKGHVDMEEYMNMFNKLFQQQFIEYINEIVRQKCEVFQQTPKPASSQAHVESSKDQEQTTVSQQGLHVPFPDHPNRRVPVQAKPDDAANLFETPKSSMTQRQVPNAPFKGPKSNVPNQQVVTSPNPVEPRLLDDILNIQDIRDVKLSAQTVATSSKSNDPQQSKPVASLWSKRLFSVRDVPQQSAASSQQSAVSSQQYAASSQQSAASSQQSAASLQQSAASSIPDVKLSAASSAASSIPDVPQQLTESVGGSKTHADNSRQIQEQNLLWIKSLSTHVKVSPEICLKNLTGNCKRGEKCNLQHLVIPLSPESSDVSSAQTVRVSPESSDVSSAQTVSPESSDVSSALTVRVSPGSSDDSGARTVSPESSDVSGAHAVPVSRRSTVDSSAIAVQVPQESQEKCRFFIKGYCKNGEQCKFQHPKNLVSPDRPGYSNASGDWIEVCIDYLEGNCKQEECKYDHPTPRCYFDSINKCKKGKTCSFIHPKKQCERFQRGLCSLDKYCPEDHPIKVCKHFLKEKCTHGNSCCFLHPASPASQPPVATQVKVPQDDKTSTRNPFDVLQEEY